MFMSFVFSGTHLAVPQPKTVSEDSVYFTRFRPKNQALYLNKNPRNVARGFCRLSIIPRSVNFRSLEPTLQFLDIRRSHF